MSDKYPNGIVEWDKPLKSKRSEFQYILNCIVCMNLKLYLYRYCLSTSNPTVCHETAESIWHLIYFCKRSSDFWRHVLSWLKDNCIWTGIQKESDTIFGKFDIDEDFILINNILLLGKHYTYSKKCRSSPSTVHDLIAWIKRIDSQGLSFKSWIARDKDKRSKHYKKWEKLVDILVY